MPSDTRIYRDGKTLRTSRKAYEQIYKPRGWRLTPSRPQPISPPTVGGDQTGFTPDDQKES